MTPLTLQAIFVRRVRPNIKPKTIELSKDDTLFCDTWKTCLDK